MLAAGLWNMAFGLITDQQYSPSAEFRDKPSPLLHPYAGTQCTGTNYQPIATEGAYQSLYLSARKKQQIDGLGNIHSGQAALMSISSITSRHLQKCPEYKGATLTTPAQTYDGASLQLPPE